MPDEPTPYRAAPPQQMHLLDRLGRAIASLVATPLVHFIALLLFNAMAGYRLSSSTAACTAAR